MSDKKTFHLAITMAGAISAGAYTAGVMDYLLEVLDKWEVMKKNADFDGKLPTHNLQIDILSGASAGGMTACVSSIVLHQKNKHPLISDLKKNKRSSVLEPEREMNRLYNSWVNLGHGGTSLPGNKAIFELLGDKDVKEIEELRQKTNEEVEGCIEFPISFFNSSIIRKIAEDATELNENEKSEIKTNGLPEYVAKDFDTFVTLTSLKGFKKTISLQANVTGGYKASYTTIDHRDVMMFNFGEKNKTPGVINVNLPTETNDSEGLQLLRNAAVSTGAFPIGLEYGFIERDAGYINDNLLMRKIHGRDLIVPENELYASAMIDGGLINNEPFELTEILLKTRMEKEYGIADKRRYSMLMIDPFPSESVEISTNNQEDLGTTPKLNDQYPYSFLGAIGQLVLVARTQMLVKSTYKEKEKNKDEGIETLIKKAFDQDELNTFLIAPRRYDLGDKAVAEGSKAIACGTLGGFGGFLDKSFREHDFFLGRNNCKSFLQSHFKFRATEVTDKDSPFCDSYSEEAKKLFLIERNGEKWLPILPDVNILYNNETEKKKVIKAEYAKNKYPQISNESFDKLFKQLNRKISHRLGLVLGAFLKGKWGFLKSVTLTVNSIVAFVRRKNYLLDGAKSFVHSNLKEWKIMKSK